MKMSHWTAFRNRQAIQVPFALNFSFQFLKLTIDGKFRKIENL